ncbi:MAG: tRNA 2-selenouridine(34) synthase MnmH, partial [Terriglobales bacterium]
PPLTLEAIRAFDAVLDARSPSEFAQDHLPGALNCPVLDDEERAHVGTLYKQHGAFEAKRIGAPLVARNIAKLLDGVLANRPRHWRPLVYCWRGGARSGALLHVMRQVGWDATRLEGGYKAFRRQVVTDLEQLPGPLELHVVCGATGSGKSRFLEALQAAGAQVLDLEALAAHRGSILGDLPDALQPGQKAFETAIWAALSACDPRKPVFVESESRKVGNLRVPEELMLRMRAGRCYRLDTLREQRVALLLEDYAHLIAQPAVLVEKIECLAPLHGTQAIERWKSQVSGGQWAALVADLLDNHYDPAYRRSLYRNYRDAQTALAVGVAGISREHFSALARRLLQAQ